MPQASEDLGATLFDSMQNGLIAAVEIGGNRLLALDETALQGCTELQGYCIAIDITDTGALLLQQGDGTVKTVVYGDCFLI